METIPLTLQNVLLVYGPLGVMTLVSLGVAAYLWRALRETEGRCRELLEEKGTVRAELLRELIQHEKEATLQYMELGRSVERALELLHGRLGNGREVQLVRDSISRTKRT
jgi:hypothetical protein